ncbi:hypothetical protein GF366_04760 [Candidatus Peregrinibacteria bacterium]|nr:hypothetical protein [Candidatus Peregrinibacteria bacterium]
MQNKRSKDKSRLRFILLYLVVPVFLSLLVLTIVMQLWNANLFIPFQYKWDSLFYSMIVKGIVDNGWYWYNSFIGAPDGLYIFSFPAPVVDVLNFLIIKVISFFTNSWAAILNFYYVLTYPLTAVTSLYVLKRFDFSYIPALVGSMLFTFLPFHFYRGEAHLTTSAYYLIPLMVMVLLWITSGKFDFKGKFKDAFLNKKYLFAVVLTVLVAAVNIHYAFFSCYLLLIAGFINLFNSERRFWRRMVVPLSLIFVIILVVSANLLPTWIYEYQYGENPIAYDRNPIEAEIYALRVPELILPLVNHRISFFAGFRGIYFTGGESPAVSLGIFGSIGFLFLLFILFLKKKILQKGIDKKADSLVDVSSLNVFALFVAMTGFLGSIFAHFISSSIRCYNRMSIFIAFFSIFAFVFILNVIKEKKFRTKLKALLVYCIYLFVLVLGIFDQTIPAFVPSYEKTEAIFFEDETFIKKIEEEVPAGSMIFQLPYHQFPEGGHVAGMLDYDHFRAYLHSENLKWSYGGMKGEPNDFWQREIAKKPINEFLEEIKSKGFSGVYVDTNAYLDKGKSIISKIEDLVKSKPILSENGRFVFFKL